MPDVTIGTNTIVGAFSFVNADIPENVVAVGVPANVIRIIKNKNYEYLS
jgi:acetyltransferase-like isoleucine patch superfamily enzyme